MSKHPHKRFFLLYKLGIPIPSHLMDIYGRISKFFETVKTVDLYDSRGRNHKCCVDSENNIVYFYYEKSVYIDKSDWVHVNMGFKKLKESIINERVFAMGEVDEIVNVVLRHNGIKFEHFKITIKDFNNPFFENLKI